MKYKQFKTRDGITVLSAYINNINGVLFELHFKAGAYNDPIGKAGLAHFCEHALMGFSTKTHTREQRNELDRKFQYKNAYTSNYEMVFVVCATKKEIEEAVDNMTDPFANIIYPQEEFDSEFKIISDEINTRKKTNSRLLGMILNKNQAKNKEINNCEQSQAGSIESISKIRLKDLQNFIESYINKKNLVVNVSGNLAPKEIERLIDKYVSPRIKADGEIGFNRMDNLGDKGPHYYFSKSWEKSKALLCYDYKIEKHEKSAFYDLESAALRNITSKVMQEEASTYFRNKKELCYGCSFGMFKYIDATYVSFHVECQQENVDKIIEAYPDFIKSVEEQFSEERFNKHKKRTLGNMNFDVRGISAQADVNYDNYDKYGKILGENEDKILEKIYNSIKYEQAKEKIKLLKGKKPNIVIITDDEKYKDFDYKDYCKKILVK